MKHLVLGVIFAMLVVATVATLHARPTHEARANQLLSPCPLGTKNLPPRMESEA